MWSHHGLHPATREASDIVGTCDVRWGEAPAPWDVETDAGMGLEDLMVELGRLEVNALGAITHGDVLHERQRP